MSAIWPKFDGLLSVVDLQMLSNNKDVSEFSRFEEIAKTVKFRQFVHEMNIFGVDDLVIMFNGHKPLIDM